MSQWLNSFGSFLTPSNSIFWWDKDLTHQPGGVALCAASPAAVVGSTCRTVGGIATPTVWNTLPHVPSTSLRNRNRFPACSTSVTWRRSRSAITSAHSNS